MEIIINNDDCILDFKTFVKPKISNKKNFDKKNVVILGNFDGVHLGHHKIILQAIKKAKKYNLNVLIYLFKSHLKKNENIITTLSEKLYILSKYDIDFAYIEDFEDIFNLSCEDFVEEILLNKLNAKYIYCGFNYTFGKNKKGDVKKLEKIIKNRAKLNIINPIMYNFSNSKLIESKIEDLKENLDKGFYVISSTCIRTLIENGQLKKVKELLARNYIIMGKVIHGKQIARTLGFPTANLKSNNKIYPIFGVYGSKVKVENDNFEYSGITNIGKNPTLENEGIHIETNIYNFDKNIYDKIIIIELIENIRLERKMSSLEELKKQISSDKEIWNKKINENK